MSLAAYSSALNVTPEVASGYGFVGQAVCNPGSGWVVATTANRAGGTVHLQGIALENFTPGATFRVCTSGYVPADVVGPLSGTGRFVNVNSGGGLVRSSAQSSDSIGRYNNDGSVDVDSGLQDGGAFSGNATQVQGTPLGVTSASYSQILAGDGTQLRSRLGTYNLRDFGAIENSVSNADMTANVAAWNLMKSRLSSGSELVIDKGYYAFNAPISWFDGIAYGNVCNILLNFRGPRDLGGLIGRPKFYFGFSDYTGSAASITTLSNGGTGSGRSHYMMTLTGCTGITTAMAAELVGLPVRVFSTSNNQGNSLTTVLCAIPSDGTMVLYNPRAAATAPDYGLGGSLGNGKVCWRVERRGLDLRMTATHVHGGEFAMLSGYQLGALVNLTESPSPITNGGTGRTIGHCTFRDCAFITSSNDQKARYGLRLAEDIIPASNSSGSRYIVNGDGYPIPYAPFQVDTSVYDNCVFYSAPGAKQSGVAGFGRAGQAEKHEFHHCTFVGVRNGYMVPTATHIESGASGNSCHADFYDTDFAHVGDTVFALASNAFTTSIIGGKGETGIGRILQDTGGVFANAVNVQGIHVQSYAYDGATPSSICHPTQTLITTNREGPINIRDCSFYLNSDNSKIRILELNHSQGTVNNRCATVNFDGNHIMHSVNITRRRASMVNANRGPFKFLGTEKLNVKLNGVVTVVTFSLANFTAALAAIGADAPNMNEVRGYEVATLIEHTLGRANLRSWSPEDDESIWIYSQDEAAGTIQITAYAGPEPDANVQLGFNVAGIGTTSACLQMTTDSCGCIEGSVSSSADEVILSWGLNKMTVHTTGANMNVPGPFCKSYANKGCNVSGSTTIADANTSVTVTFPVAEIVDYEVTALVQSTNAGAPSFGVLRVANKTLAGFDIVTGTAPGAGTSIKIVWTIGRPA